MSPEGLISSGGVLLGGCRDRARGQRLVLKWEPELEGSGVWGNPHTGGAPTQLLHQVTSVAKSLHCEKHRGLTPRGTVPGHHPCWLLSLPSFPASSRNDPIPRSGAEGPLAAHTHHRSPPFSRAE